MTAGIRLPRTALPRRYQLRIEPDLPGGTFHGEVTVHLDIAQETSQLCCHSADLDVTEVEVNGRPAAALRVDPEREQLHIELDRPLPPGPAQLCATFSGVLNDKLVGFYRSTYHDEEGEHVLGVTQFEAPHARRAFPCWDEPDLKATFEVTLVVAPDDFAVSNGPELARTPLADGRHEVRFGPTIPMSTYLVAWVVGRLVATEPRDVDGIAVRGVCRPGQQHLAGTALEVAEHSLRWFAGYYGLAYPAEKLDLVAVPDFAFGAMENLGCVTFRDVLLLADPDQLTHRELEAAATVIAHEIAHMWFGDLVTMSWWEGIWLNEAFATFMELACIDDYRPEWDVWTTFGLARAGAFAVDATSSTRAIEFEVVTPADADAMFDVLTYEKGAGVLRMVEQFLGPEVFRAGVRAYLQQHQLGNTVAEDLWRALERVTDEPVREVMHSWIHQGGHPVVAGTRRGAELRLSQRPASIAADAPDQHWLVPVRMRVGTDTGTVAEHRVLLGPEPATVDIGDGAVWVCLNAGGTGFYRTAYDAGMEAALLEAVPKLHPLERFALLDDRWAAALAGSATVEAVVEAVRALAGDPSESILQRVARAVTEVRLLGGGVHAGDVARFAAITLGPRLRDADAECAGVALRLLAMLGDPDAIARGRELLDAEGVHPELAAAAIDAVASAGGSAEFDRFLERYHRAATPQEEQRYLAALTRFGDADLLDRLLEMCRTEVRSQNAPYTLARAMANPRHGGRVWRFVRDHWEELCERFPENSIPRMASGITFLWEPEVADDVARFFEVPRVTSGEQQVRQHLEVVAAQQRLRSAALPQLRAALDAG